VLDPEMTDHSDGGDGAAEQGAERDSASTDIGASARSSRTIQREGLEAAHREEQNFLLRALPLEEYGYLLAYCASERLLLKQTLVEPNVRIDDIYFPRVGVCSMLAEEQDGGTIEVGTIGPEGFIGIAVILGGRSMPYRIIVQIEGDAWRIRADDLRRIVDERRHVRHLLLRYTQYFTNQLSQSVACNRLHTLEERCARWVLMTHDRVHGDAFEMTQEFLSMMLGVHRPAVSVAMGMLQNAGIVRYARGRVTVLDRPRLEEASCDCYAITRAEHERLLDITDVR
jgi:CRP-like cAMP-binding protein